MDSVLKLMGERMRKARTNLRLTQEQVAEKVGIEPAYYGMLERGTKTPGFEVLIKIAECLKMDPGSLITKKQGNEIFYENLNNLIKGLGEGDKKYVAGIVRDAVNHLSKKQTGS